MSIIKVYDNFMSEYGGDDLMSPEKVGWVSKYDQYIRFKILLNDIPNGDSVLDWGCGLSHMINYINEKNIDIKYHGIDINNNTINIAKKLFPGQDIRLGDIDTESIIYDWVVASGIFSVGVTIDTLLNKINKAYEISKKGIRFNLLLPLNQFIDNGFSVFDPEALLEKLSDIYENVSLIKDYCFDDFTIYINKYL